MLIDLLSTTLPISYICVYIHTHESTYMYSINSSAYYDVRVSIPIHMYMTILSFIYTYIYVYMYMYIIYIHIYIHTYIYFYFMKNCPCPISSCPVAFSPPFSVQSLACPPTVLPTFIYEVVPSGVLPAISGIIFQTPWASCSCLSYQN